MGTQHDLVLLLKISKKHAGAEAMRSVGKALAALI